MFLVSPKSAAGRGGERGGGGKAGEGVRWYFLLLLLAFVVLQFGLPNNVFTVTGDGVVILVEEEVMGQSPLPGRQQQEQGRP